MPTYVDVILPLALENRLTYLLPTEFVSKSQKGTLCIVPLGKSKYYTAVIAHIHNEKPIGIEIKKVEVLLDFTPLTDNQLKLWHWIAFYYMCTEGEVMKAALPTGMKLESETRVILNEDFTQQKDLSPRELDIWCNIPLDKSITAGKLQKRLGGGDIMPFIRKLLQKKAIYIDEQLVRHYRPLTETMLRLPNKYRKEDALTGLFFDIRRAKKQQEALTIFLSLINIEEALNSDNTTNLPDLPRKKLQDAGATPSAIKALIERGALEKYEHTQSRICFNEDIKTQQPYTLNEQQKEGLKAIENVWREKNICLLHGVTSSGKTEVYIQLIDKTLRQGKQVLYLLPEIALTTQITTRLSRVFAHNMGVYHSKFTDNERVELWKKQLSTEPFGLILGVRSSIFLPWKNLGLIIIDEEHETSYKQYDPAPRYNARDTALILANLTGAKTLLGTATPSIETYHNAQIGKYGLVEMLRRFGDRELPKIIVEDMKELKRKKRMRMPFTPRLIQEMGEALESKEQVILFQNRRGYSPILECNTCGWTPRCTACDVPLTVHKKLNKIVCHYCGAVYNFPPQCPQCEAKNFRDKGYGTERIEDIVKRYYPQASTRRMDLDTTQSRTAYDNIISDFAYNKTNILIGTQMVTKGLDFENVHVVGIINADHMLNAPDFRAREHSFQMMSQVAGRAGRKGRRGLVVLQTHQADLPVIKQIVDNDYKDMYNTEIKERKTYLYPPFCRIINIYIRHRNDRICQDAAEKFIKLLPTKYANNTLGPEKPVVARIKFLYIRKLMLKIPLQWGITEVRKTLHCTEHYLLNRKELHGTSISFDIDPA